MVECDRFSPLFVYVSLSCVLLLHSAFPQYRLRHNYYTSVDTIVRLVLPALLCPLGVPTGVILPGRHRHYH